MISKKNFLKNFAHKVQNLKVVNKTKFFETFDNNKKNHRVVFQLKAPAAVIKDAFSRSHCCYGNLLCHKKNKNVFTNESMGIVLMA